MRRFWRAVIVASTVVVAISIGCTLGDTTWALTKKGLWHYSAELRLPRVLTEMQQSRWYLQFSPLGFKLLVTSAVFVILRQLMDARGRAGKETRCRKCGYILRGLTEPRCPECGERI